MSQAVKSRDTTEHPKPRQKPGAACEECRRRKLRCDRRQPQCRLCEASGVECQVITARQSRGPKRGYLKVLQDRIAALEGALLQHQSTINLSGPTDDHSLDAPLLDDQIDLSGWQLPMMDDEMPVHGVYAASKTNSSSGALTTDGRSGVNSTSPPHRSSSIPVDLTMQDVTSRINGIEHMDDICELKISDLIQADLDQLYFDRIHHFMPIQHQSCYFSWRRQPVKTEAQSCLQYAIWTLGASVSALRENIGDSLYQYARRGLEALDSKNTSLASTDLEQVQAWLLLAIYEFMGVDFRRGWISAGRAFRLIQLNWLHGTDGWDLTRAQTDWIESEQKRRTFWMAYCLDRFVSMRTGSPPTFSERVAIRLPCPEANFQNDQPILMGFLSDALATDTSIASTFTECIVVATISGRALSHRNQCLAEDLYFSAAEDFWNRHQWINAILTQRMEAFAAKSPLEMQQQADPMLLFISLMWQTIILHLYQTMACVIPSNDEKRDLITEYKKRSSAAAQEIVDLTNKLSHLNSLKVHPLTLIPLSLCVEFLILYHKPGDVFTKQLQDIAEAMRGLKRFNNLGQGVMQLFEDQLHTNGPFQASTVH
ncbi:fungal-specific transcription factor domain-containing protein [Aspergillus granulosus]|uniref:Fungal-specific transcription factor domain-containing protein n=1 Tax=Aspergillus granulosus TaxID=176169 RepID=A0ABR4GV30_9EURO